MDAHANLAVSLVATAPSPASSGTSLVVTAAQGARFPAVPFNASIWPAATQPDPSNCEIVRVTAKTTDTLTITRAQEDTSARTVVVGDQIAATITAKTLTDVEAITPLSGTLGSRPAAATGGRLYFATDVNGGTLYRDTGAAWVQIAVGLKGGLPPALVCYSRKPGIALAGGLGALTTANRAQGHRVIVPKTGTLNEVYIYVGTSSGNIEVGILDTTATTRNRLWTSGSIACPAASAYRKIGDPGLAVVEGDQLDFYLNADNTTATFVRLLNFQVTATTVLPSVFFPSPLGGKPAIVWQGPASTFPLGTTLAESSMSANVLTAHAVLAVIS